jgi:chemotaxis family two-component system sensor kinase Cph1
MNVRDIVNRDLVNLTNCESEPIHIPGAIQPHGFLLGLSPEPEFRILYCSGNAETYTGSGYAALLGKSFAAAFGSAEETQLTEYLKSADFQTGDPVSLQLGQTPYSCTMHYSGGILVIEAEPFPDGFRNLPDLYQQTRRFVAFMEQTRTLQELCQSVAEETRRVTGYDRVMIYRFDEDYNGEVIGEAVREDLEPFLNLHYPHTDIPAQARELYLRNLLRMIVDVEYVPVPIYTIDTNGEQTLDLSQSVLRSVSPIHIQYLNNMGVGATMSISLVHNKRLWGLIACHHYGPKNIPHYTRLSAQLQGHFLTSQIGVRESSESFEEGKLVAAALDEIMPQIAGLDENGIGQLMQRPELLQLANADGVMLSFKGRLYTQGDVPSSEGSEALAAFVQQHSSGGNFVTEQLRSLSHELPPTLPEGLAGIVYHSLVGEGEDFILWLRSDRREEVLWAGDPTKAIVKDEKGLSPRKSFEQWKGLKAGSSRPWTEAELAATSNFAYSLQKGLSLILLASEEQRYRLLSEQLQQANSELENINWISTHDLQEPLRKIQVFSSRLKSKLEAHDVSPVILHDMERMNDAATRMQSLVNDIHSYSKFNHQELDLVHVEMDRILDDVLRDLIEELNEGRLQLLRESLPAILGEPFLLRQLFTNLIRNALKFHKSGAPATIRIACEISGGPEDSGTVESYYRITFSDDGIGFSNEFAETIFGIFKRLHSQAEYRGTGIGLAICRKIMQRHNGFITAQGEEGIGAQFHLYFPRG